MSAEQLITKHLDIWTSAHKTRSSAGRGSSNKLDLYGIKKLRELILELAVRGKLVPQDPNDEPASELLKKIAAEKASLIKEGKIKKEKPLPEITDEEKKFEVPACWSWSRLGNISAQIHYGYTASSNAELSDVRLLRITDIQDNNVDWCSVPGCEIDSDKVSQYELQDQDILIARTGGTIGKSYLVKDINVCSVFASYLIRVKHLGPFSSEYKKIYLGSQLYWSQLYSKSMGTGQPNVNGEALKSLVVSIPPQQEQKRISAKVNELMAFCDELEQAETDNIKAHAQLVEALLTTLTNSKDHQELQANWQRIAEHFDTLFTTEDSIDQLKQTILQLAVMGKLVPQDPNDEPASELLKKISAEKAQLIKEGKIKKEKLLPEITDEEKPFEIPEKWRYIRVGTAFTLMSGTTFENERELESGEFLYVKVGDMSLENNETEIQTSSRFINPQEKEKRSLIPAKSIIFPKRGGAIATNKKRYVRNDIFVDLNIMAITPFEGVNLQYAMIWISGIDLALLNSGTSVPQINNKDIEPLLFPLPPLPEQEKIVLKVEQLFNVCNELKYLINRNRLNQVFLTDVLVEQAVF